MNILSELMGRPGVLAAGEYAYRGDRFSYRGTLTSEQARMLSILCRAATMTAVMAGDALADLEPAQGLSPVRGWMMRGQGRTLCVIANVFCLLDNTQADMDDICALLQSTLADRGADLV